MSDRATIEQNFEPHSHDALVHTHRHFHVTHNWSPNAQTFEHLTWAHEHEHDHPAITHEHFPHEDVAREHLSEAHDHDHSMPVRPEVAAEAQDATGRT